MPNFEQFKFLCNCGEELATDKDRKVTCPKCKMSYEVEFLQKETKQIDTIN
jgi:hypothetical protein